MTLYSGSVTLFVYTLVIGFAMVRNQLGIPYRWLFRPRGVVYAIPYALLFMDLNFWKSPDTVLVAVMSLMNLILIGQAMAGFVAIRRYLKEQALIEREGAPYNSPAAGN